MLKRWFFYLWGFHFFPLNHKNSFPNTELINKSLLYDKDRENKMFTFHVRIKGLYIYIFFVVLACFLTPASLLEWPLPSPLNWQNDFIGLLAQSPGATHHEVPHLPSHPSMDNMHHLYLVVEKKQKQQLYFS